MSDRAMRLGRGSTRWRVNQHGIALAVCLPILAVLAMIGLAAYAAAIVELRMAANVEYQVRAFEAAEFAIEQALLADDLGTAYTYTSPRIVPAQAARLSVPGRPGDAFSYRLYFAEAQPLDGTRAGSGDDVLAFHFVIEATGYSARGAQDLHVQGFYVARTMGWTGDGDATGCPDQTSTCNATPYPPPERTYWLQPDSE